jgi:C_GCAxxG_C_C family probable redox protein
MNCKNPAPAEAGIRAGKYYKLGYNCAESIFLTFRELLAPEVDEELVRIATPFGGGLGRAGCLCGALSGAVLMLGLAKGRTSHMEPRGESYILSHDLEQRFKRKFGSTCCRVLNKNSFGSPEQAVICMRIITETAEMFMNCIEEKNLAGIESGNAC